MITQLYLTDFKNFRDATLKLGPLTVLVGTNASGKSNLRDAFRFLHGMARGYTLAEIIGEKYVEGGVLQWKGIRGGTREVAYAGEGRFALETKGQFSKKSRVLRGTPFCHRIEVEVGNGTTPPRVCRESLRYVTNVVFDSHPVDNPPKQDGSPHILVDWPGGSADNRTTKPLRFLDNRPVLSQFHKHTAVIKHDDKHHDALAAQALATVNSLGSMRFLDLSPTAMKTPSLPGQTVLGDRGENLSSVLQAICEDGASRRVVAEWINELTPLDVVDFDFVADQTGKVLLTLLEANGQRTSAHSASDGTLRFLAMIAAVLGPDAGGFYFLEELDNGIHPTRLYLLLQLIEHHAKQGKVQVVATTHSPQLLAMLSDQAREHASLVYRVGDAPDARIRRIMEIPEAKRVLEEQNLARLHESGWLEDAVAFAAEEEEADA